MDSHRINQLSVVESIPRQTPNNDFGTVMSQTVIQAAKLGAGIVGGALGSPVVSAAVSAASAVVGVAGSNKPQALATSQASTMATPMPGSVIGSAAGAATPMGGTAGGGSTLGGLGSVGGVGGATSGGDSWALLQAQQAVQSNGQSFELQYLQLQDQMNKESQTFTALSNIMKVRADAAKNAINNIH